MAKKKSGGLDIDSLIANESIIDSNVADEMEEATLTYAIKTITGRAIPDVRDGLKPVQRRILYGAYKGNYVSGKQYTKNAKIVGDCFVKDTLIYGMNGLINIQDAKKNDEVYTQSAKHKVIEEYIMPERPLLKVTLENGLNNICTEDQKFKVLDNSLNFIWKSASELSNNDYIVCKGGINNYTDDCGLDEELAYVFGYFLADGFIDDDKKRGYRRFGVCGGKSKIPALERIKEIINKKFDTENIINSKGSLKYIRFSPSASEKIIDLFGVENKKFDNIDKSFMKVINSKDEIFYSFLSGFIDGDGSISVHNNAVVISSSCKTFLDKLQISLLNRDILSANYMLNIDMSKKKDTDLVKKKNMDHWQLYVSIGDIKEKLSLYNENHNKKLSIPKKDRKVSTKYKIIPYLGKLVLNEFSEKHIGGGLYLDKLGNKIKCGLNKSSITYRKNIADTFNIYRTNIESTGIKKKMEVLDSKYLSFVESVFNDNLYFIKVKNIVEIKADITYDIQVENVHEFIANGMIVANCMGNYHPY